MRKIQCYLVKMKLRANPKVLNEWQLEVGTVDEAADRIRNALGCSHSKAEKLAGGRYFHGLTLSEQKELTKLVKKDSLFPAPGKARGTKAS